MEDKLTAKDFIKSKGLHIDYVKGIKLLPMKGVFVEYTIADLMEAYKNECLEAMVFEKSPIHDYGKIMDILHDLNPNEMIKVVELLKEFRPTSTKTKTT